MFLKPCPHCQKEIPNSIAICPYCQRDESGQQVVVEQAPVALDAQSQSDLEQLGHEDPFVRKSAVERLSQKGPALVPVLINLVNEHTRKGVSEAAKLLGRFRDRRAVSTLVQALKIGDEDLRISSVWALSQFNESQAVEELLHEAERNNPAVQGYIAHILATHQDPRIVPVLIKLARHTHPEVSFHAVWALGELGDKTAIPPLRSLLHRKDPLIRAAAETALRRLGGSTRRSQPVKLYLGGIVGIVLGVSACLWYFYK